MIILKNIRSFLIGILLFPYLVYAQIPEYYFGIDFSGSPTEIKNQLSERISKYHISFPYSSSSTDTWDILQQSNQDPKNPNNIVLIYSDITQDKEYRDGWGNYSDFENGKGKHSNAWNREHVFPKSLFRVLESVDVYDLPIFTDAHNLKPVRRGINVKRGVRRFADGSGDAKVIDPTDSKSGFYPGDQWIGDVARIIMYMIVHYDTGLYNYIDLDANEVGTGSNSFSEEIPDIFLKWNALDPPSEFEKIRNQIIYSYQESRNPFIDNYNLATRIWGGPPTYDLWGISPLEVEIFPTITSTNIYLKRDVIEESVNYFIYDMSGNKVQSGKALHQIDISNIPIGNYIIELKLGNSSISKKIIKI